MAPTIPVVIRPGNPKLVDKVRDVIRRKHYSFRDRANLHRLDLQISIAPRIQMMKGSKHPQDDETG
jgi:hypothetical protein